MGLLSAVATAVLAFMVIVTLILVAKYSSRSRLSPAHMRYSVRRLRRKLPKATIILSCWIKDMEPARLEQLREGAKADLAAASLGEAIKLCIAATGFEMPVGTMSAEVPAMTA